MIFWQNEQKSMSLPLVLGRLKYNRDYFQNSLFEVSLGIFQYVLGLITRKFSYFFKSVLGNEAILYV